jgi:hypothetical protein
METGMQNLGEGGEAKASQADRDDADTMQPTSATGGIPTVRGEEDVDQSERGASIDAAMGANMDPDLMVSTGERSSPRGGAGSLTVDDDLIGTASPRLGAGETAAYGETIENAPAPTDADD